MNNLSPSIRLGKHHSDYVRKTFEQSYFESNRTYEDVLKFTGFTHAEAWAVSINPADQIPFETEPASITIAASPIHGLGVFAKKAASTGDALGPARIQEKRTPAGRYCNHSGSPNAEMVLRETGIVELVAIKPIAAGEEVVTDYYLNFVNTRIESTPADMRGKILALEAAMRAMPERQIEFKVTHHFAPKIYMREMFIPKGATLTGKIHLTEHLNILSQGHLRVLTEDGMKTLRASTVIKSKPGIKRAGHALEDSVWITVHHNPTDERDIQKIEDMLVVDSYEELLSFIEKKQIEGGQA